MTFPVRVDSADEIIAMLLCQEAHDELGDRSDDGQGHSSPVWHAQLDSRVAHTIKKQGHDGRQDTARSIPEIARPGGHVLLFEDDEALAGLLARSGPAPGGLRGQASDSCKSSHRRA